MMVSIHRQHTCHTLQLIYDNYDKAPKRDHRSSHNHMRNRNRNRNCNHRYNRNRNNNLNSNLNSNRRPNHPKLESPRANIR